jgi:hypothetical protein
VASIDIDPKPTAILQALREREAILQRPRAGAPTADLEALLDAEFCESGASGRHDTREAVLQGLEQRRAGAPDLAAPVQMSELRGLRLAEDVYLRTDLLSHPDRTTRRSSIGRRRDGECRIIYHQGILVRPS